jgi:NAD(P)-dependent dehydrogenase (short-subunit alcohol dehydrogenase family)
MPTSLQDKTVIVTGAAQGIGREIAHELARRGANVVAADINDGKLQAVCEEIVVAGGASIGITCDVSRRVDCEEVVRRGAEHFGAVNGLVNNASIFASIKMMPLWEIDEKDWDALMAVNLRGVWQMTKAAVTALTGASGASVVNISSSTMLFGRPNYAHYVASKAGVVGLTRAMARELGPLQIRVNALAPGMIVTEMPRETVTEQQRADLIAGQCLKRAGRPQDIARVVAFLLGADSEFMTGQLLVADGGYVLH